MPKYVLVPCPIPGCTATGHHYHSKDTGKFFTDCGGDESNDYEFCDEDDGPYTRCYEAPNRVIVAPDKITAESITTNPANISATTFKPTKLYTKENDMSSLSSRVDHMFDQANQARIDIRTVDKIDNVLAFDFGNISLTIDGVCFDTVDYPDFKDNVANILAQYKDYLIKSIEDTLEDTQR